MHIQYHHGDALHIRMYVAKLEEEGKSLINELIANYCSIEDPKIAVPLTFPSMAIQKHTTP